MTKKIKKKTDTYERKTRLSKCSYQARIFKVDNEQYFNAYEII